MKPSIKMIQKKNELQDGNYPIYLRITINRKSKFYSMPYKCKLSEWNDKKGEFNSRFKNNISYNKVLRNELNLVTDIIQEIISKYKKVTLIRFDNYYRSSYNTEILFIDYLQYEIKRLTENGQVAYASSHQQTINNLISFCPKIKEFSFEEIEFSFLNNFETFLRKRGANDSGIAVYMRNIRSIYNKAIKAKIVDKKYYPFEDYKISKFKKRKRKKALESKDIQKLVDFNIDSYPKGKNPLYAYLFSYYARGMNLTDIATLKWSELSNYRFEYTRSKTGIHLKIKLPEIDKINEILSFYKFYRPFETDYIFPILHKDASEMSALEIMKRKDSVRSYYNKQLKIIAKMADIQENIYFYNARHSFATKALRSNVNMTIIKQSLGHQNISTTENYVEDFKDDDVNRIIDELF